MLKASLAGLLLLSYGSEVLSCTHFRLQAQDKSVVVGRSMEFAENLETDIYTVNRESQFTSKTPDNKEGLSWKAKYGYLALDGFHLFPVSGLNEAGLSFDILYLPGFAKFQNYDTANSAKALPYYQIGDYILGNFNRTEDVKENLKTINLYAKPLNHSGQSVVFPVHFVVTDKTGKGIIIEYIDGHLNVYDDKVGVLTNSPEYPWQVTNLSNYIHLSPNNPKPIKVDGVTYSTTGQGAGAIGLPGDYSPPSRFVKTAYLLETAIPAENALKGVNLAAHILNNVDIPYGAVRGTAVHEDPNQTMDSTQWIVIKDLTHQVLYFRSYENLALEKVEMRQLSLEPDAKPHRMKLDRGAAEIKDVTSQF